ERGVLTAADHVCAVGELVAAARAVVHADAGRDLLLVAAPATLLLAVALLVVPAVVALVVGLGVAGLRVALLAVARLPVALVVAGLGIAALLRLAVAPLLGMPVALRALLA